MSIIKKILLKTSKSIENSEILSTQAEKIKSFIEENELDDKAKRILNTSKDLAEKGLSDATVVADQIKSKVHKEMAENENISKAVDIGADFISGSYTSAKESASNIYDDIRYSDEELKRLKNNIENQSGYYREIIKNKRESDTIILGGETLASLLSLGVIPKDINAAYEAAFPDLSSTISLTDKARELDGSSLDGFISAVKGKLFEQKYVDYLNEGNLPDGYSASLAESTTQTGWDIKISGPDNETVSLLQAKATDSVSYVKEAIEKYPNIDVVTTEEVYSHLVMTGVSEGIIDSSIMNEDLTESINGAVDAAELSMDFTPPLFTLAFIAFTSYKDESLSLYQKANEAADRTGKAYMSYILGGSVAAITNTWWLGLVGTVGSRILSDRGNRKFEIFKKIRDVETKNQEIIDALKS